MTQRIEIEKILSKEEKTLIDMAAYFHCETFQILEDLHHIAKSIKPQRELVMLPAECKICHFVFKERQDKAKFKKPTKCPKCNSERILAPTFCIRERKK